MRAPSTMMRGKALTVGLVRFAHPNVEFIVSLIRRAAVVAALSAAVIVPTTATAQAAPQTAVRVVAHGNYGYGDDHGNNDSNRHRHYGLLTSLLLILL